MSASAPSRPVLGVLWMLLSGLAFIGVNTGVRFVGDALPAPQSAFLRFAWSFLFLLPALLPLIKEGVPKAAWPLVGGRAVAHTVAVSLWFFAMTSIPMAEVTAIGYLNPICVTIGAAVLFSERLAFRRIAAIALAIIGTLIVLRPGLREVGAGHVAQIAASVCFAASYLFVKPISQYFSAAKLVAIFSASVTLGLLPLALWVWVPVTLEQMAIMGVVASMGTLAHYAMTRAFAEAPLTVTQPVIFLQLIWASLIGLAIFGEPIDGYVLLGGGLIILAVCYITFREAQLRRAEG